MTYESSDLIDDFDPASALAASDGLTFRYEVLIASLTSKLINALNVLVLLGIAAVGAALLYFAPVRFEIGDAAYSLMPSLLIVLLFALASTAHYALNLAATRRQAQVALARQVLAHIRVQKDLTLGDWK